jgi:hypothetical protein
MGVKISGLDELSKKLKKTEPKAKELEGGASVGFGELFNESFMAKYTNFSTIDEFFDYSPFKIEIEEDFDNINPEELDQYVRDYSRFEDWEDMKGTAGTEWVAKQLGF